MEAYISDFIRNNSDIISILFGMLFMIGAWQNWQWLCSPEGKPDSIWFNNTAYRIIFFILGLLLTVSSIWLLFI